MTRRQLSSLVGFVVIVIIGLTILRHLFEPSSVLLTSEADSTGLSQNPQVSEYFYLISRPHFKLLVHLHCFSRSLAFPESTGVFLSSGKLCMLFSSVVLASPGWCSRSLSAGPATSLGSNSLITSQY